MSSKQKIIEVKDHLVSGESFSVVYDESRGYAFTDSPKELNLSDYYPNTNYASHKENHQGIKDCLYRGVQSLMLRYKLSIIRKHQAGKRILDVGGGIGVFADYVSKKGYISYLTEPNSSARQLAEKKGIESFSSLNQIEKNTIFDTVSLWHVLEHVEDLDESLQKYNSLLRENGLMVIAVPNINSFDAKHYGPYWAALDVPRHQWHFTPLGLKNVLRKNGFSFLKSYPLWFDALYIALLSENYKGSKGAFIKALFIGFFSNFKAFFNGEYSSKIFVFKKD